MKNYFSLVLLLVLFQTNSFASTKVRSDFLKKFIKVTQGNSLVLLGEASHDCTTQYLFLRDYLEHIDTDLDYIGFAIESTHQKIFDRYMQTGKEPLPKD